jgi:serine/threonine protein kinase
MKSKTIGNYEVGRVIGKGSFGEVYLGKHQKTLEEVALKYIIKK